jgi:hypothetical protein
MTNREMLREVGVALMLAGLAIAMLTGLIPRWSFTWWISGVGGVIATVATVAAITSWWAERRARGHPRPSRQNPQ